MFWCLSCCVSTQVQIKLQGIFVHSIPVSTDWHFVLIWLFFLLIFKTNGYCGKMYMIENFRFNAFPAHNSVAENISSVGHQHLSTGFPTVSNRNFPPIKSANSLSPRSSLIYFLSLWICCSRFFTEVELYDIVLLCLSSPMSVGLVRWLGRFASFFKAK